jgi:diguanylate cyclase
MIAGSESIGFSMRRKKNPLAKIKLGLRMIHRPLNPGGGDPPKEETFLWRDDALRPLTLTFRRRELEEEFQKEISASENKRWRFTCVVGAAMYAIFYLLDRQIIPDLLWLCLVFRFGIVCPTLLLAFGLSFTDFGVKNINSIFLVSGSLASLGIIFMIAYAGPPGNQIYYGGLLLCVLFYYLFVPGWLVPNIISWSTFIVYELVVLFLCDLPREFLIGTSFIFFFFNLSGMFGCYVLTRMERIAFLQRLTIKSQALALQKALTLAEDERRVAESLAQIDSLTGLANRRSFFVAAEREWAQHQRNSRPLSLFMLDIDHFKKFNDTYGHRLGDRVLGQVALSLREALRKSDTACRYGGEEFVVLLPETGSEAALSLAKRILASVQETSVFHDGNHLGITASIGVATGLTTAMDSFDDLLEQADRALYKAKNSGRNQLRIWGASCLGDEDVFLTPAREDMSC